MIWIGSKELHAAADALVTAAQAAYDVEGKRMFAAVDHQLARKLVMGALQMIHDWPIMEQGSHLSCCTERSFAAANLPVEEQVR